MASRKKQQKQKAKPQSSSSSGPKLQISAENENRLRRLLLNSGRSAPSAPVDDSLSNSQKAKKLRSLYEKLSCEGFSDDQIERALSNLRDGATFEATLDWLCFNLQGDELPLKFSNGTSVHKSEGGSVGVLSKARQGWVPPLQSASLNRDKSPEVSVRIKRRQDDNALASGEPSQADWIRQYMEQQEEDESETWEDNADEFSAEGEPDPQSHYESITKEYCAARLKALHAKEKGDKKSQEQAGLTIRKLKLKMSALGLSDDFLTSAYEQLSTCALEGTPDVMLYDETASRASSDVQGSLAADQHVDESPLVEKFDDCSFKELSADCASVGDSSQELVLLEEESEVVEIGDFFSEDSQSSELLPTESLNLQRKEKLRELVSEQDLENLSGIWKKGDPLKVPKAILHQLCKRSGWEAPKFNKVLGKENCFSYAVSVLRKASGRGKSRKSGGLVTLQVPDGDEFSETTEDAQNRVSAFALYHLFPELPVQLLIKEPYASLVRKWKGGESLDNIERSVENRRIGFVESLLNRGSSRLVKSTDTASSRENQFQKPTAEQLKENVVCGDTISQKTNKKEVAENLYLKVQQERKKKMKDYKDMLEIRSALPIAEIRCKILQLLEDNSVLVVCGETGCGKTTQVPQFILDDMIKAGRGGQCSIICTQPRRIAAISVAERVAHERCDQSPGSDGSLVGYQVRLESARNEKTKLLFCTTGILLRKMAGDKDLVDITHVIVDEVHERSLLGDFLLIILKSLLEKQASRQTRKLKVILMSATVDSKLFSSYFDDCPVVIAEGRTHPVETYFLEDIYESINYRLASDSPASLEYGLSAKGKVGKESVYNNKGKKNLLLSAWGDEYVLSEGCINPFYVPEICQSYSEQTQLNLKRLNEEVIDYDLLEDLVCHVDETCDEGAILIFLPGVAEIYMLYDKLAGSYRFGGPSSDWILPLHSSIASEDQRKVFSQPPDNIRKIIIATNIAETSITIDDVVYVIDSGRHKESRYDSRKKLSSMVEDWISRANVKQRHGRAGRVKPGIAFSLYTRHRFQKLMRPFQVPEMLRMPLTELCLQIKLLSLGRIDSLLSKALEPPKEEAISSAISTLYEVGALEGNEVLTPLGYHLARLPVDVLIGKMMLFGAIFGCLSPILSISAFLSYKSPFLHTRDERQNVENAKVALLDDKVYSANESEVDRQSDHLVMMVAYSKWEKLLREKGVKSAQQFCNKYFLSCSVMHMIRDMRIQFGTLLADIGLIQLPNSEIKEKKENLDLWFSDKSQLFNIYSHYSSVVKVILCAGLYPNLAATEEGITDAALSSLKKSTAPSTKGHPIWYDGRREVHIHPSSVNCSSRAFRYPFLVFLEKVETNRVFIRDSTIISPYSILLFGGNINVQHQTGLVTIDGWLKLEAPAQTAVLFKELRLTLHSILQDLIRNPQMGTLKENEVIRSIIRLLVEEEKPLK